MTRPSQALRHTAQAQVRLQVTLTGPDMNPDTLMADMGDLLRFLYPEHEVEVAPQTRRGQRRTRRLFDADGIEVADPFADEPGGVRWDDPLTSEISAEAIKSRSGSQKQRIFEAFVRDYLAHGGDGTSPVGGLIAYEAGVLTGLIHKPRAQYWHRVTDLADWGLVQPNGVLRRAADTQELQQVHVIPARGWRWWLRNGWPL